MSRRKSRSKRDELSSRSTSERSLSPTDETAARESLSSRHRTDRGTLESQGESRGEFITRDNHPIQRVAPGQTQAESPRRSQHKAHSLIDKVYGWKNLYRAWRKVRANKGAHGLDRVTIRMFEADWELHLREIRRQLIEHRFQPRPVLRVYIPKSGDPNKLRPLGIPVVADRIVQQAIVQVVERLFDKDMSERSFGYRKGRNAHGAIATLIQDEKEAFRVVLDADIASFFDRIDHEVVMSRVRARIADGRVLDLIEAFLKAGVSEDGVVRVAEEGAPQGGVISPWLSNLVLDDLDKAIEAQGWRHVRYADDFVILCRNRQEAQQALNLVKEVLDKLKLSLNESKTRISDFREGFEFVGFRFSNYRLGVRDKSLERFKDKVRWLTRRQQGRNVEAVLHDLNPVIRGWANYVGVAEVHNRFRDLDAWIRMRTRSFKTKRRNHNDNWRLPSRRLRKWGLLSLLQCRPELRLSLRPCPLTVESYSRLLAMRNPRGAAQCRNAAR